MEDQLLRRASAGQRRDLVQDLLLRHQRVVAVLHLHGEAQRTGRARHNGNFLHGGAVRLQGRHQRVADLMVGDDALFLIVEDLVLLLRTGQDRVHGLLQVELGHGLAVMAHSAERGLVHDVSQLGAGRTGRHAGHNTKVTVGAELDFLSVQAQDALAALQIGQLDGHAAVKTARAGQRRIQGFRAVRRRQDDDALCGVKAVHLGQQLVQRLLTLVVAAKVGAAVTLLADRIDFINKDDAGRFFTRLLEQVAHLGRTHADEHLHKLTAGDGEERHTGLTSHGAGQQRFAGARRADEQDALGHLRADLLILFGVVQEVYNFLQALLGLVLARYIVEFDAGLIVHYVLLRAGLAAEQHGIAAGTAHLLHLFGRPAVDEPEQDDHRQERDQQVQQRIPDRGRLISRAELHPRILQPGDEVVVLRNGVGFVGIVVLVHKVDLLIFDLDGGQLLALQHLQEGAVVHAFHARLHHSREQENIA